MTSDNPYEELERDIQRTNNMRAMKDSMSWLNLRRRQQKSGDVGVGGEEDRSRKEGSDGGGPSSAASAGNEEEEEDDEEESGAPQAMRMPDPKEGATPQVEKLRDVKVWVAEKIVKEMEPKDLIGAIRSRGFFNYNYISHARRRTDATSSGTATPAAANRNNEMDVLYAVLGMSRSRKQQTQKAAVDD